MPTDNLTSGPAAYQGNFSGTVGQGSPAAIALCGAQEGSAAVGLVQAAGLTSHIERDERRNTYFLKSQMMVGADTLSPWCAGMVTWADDA